MSRTIAQRIANHLAAVSRSTLYGSEVSTFFDQSVEPDEAVVTPCDPVSQFW